MRASISRTFVDFPYENRVSQEKRDEYRNASEQSKIASKGRCVTVTPRGMSICDFRLAIFDSSAMNKNIRAGEFKRGITPKAFGVVCYRYTTG
jgi:hypothetical protein